MEAPIARPMADGKTLGWSDEGMKARQQIARHLARLMVRHLARANWFPFPNQDQIEKNLDLGIAVVLSDPGSVRILQFLISNPIIAFIIYVLVNHYIAHS
jgi:hypothetical protein